MLFLLASCLSSRNSKSPQQFAGNPVVAHRGAFKKNGFPENSLASLKEAIRLGCTGSEFDVWMTADDSLVIHHDPHYNQLQIEHTNYDELTRYKLSNGEQLPTLREYLRTGLQHNSSTHLVVEIKPSGVSTERGLAVAEKTVNLVKEVQASPKVVFISFSFDILQRIHEIDPAATTQYLNGDKSPAELKAAGINGADYHFSVFKKNPGWIAMAKKEHIILNTWTVNDNETMGWAIKEGFDFITTNEPEILLEKTKTDAKVRD